MPVPLLTDCCCLSAGHTPGVEIAEGIPAPFPLVAHNPAAQPPRPPPRAPRQASRTTATQAFTTCLLSDKPLSPPPASPGAIGSAVVISQHTAAAAAGASGLVPNLQDGTTDEGYENVQGEHTHMHCDEQLDHGGHDDHQIMQEQQHQQHQQQQQQHAVGSASAQAEMVDAPTQHSARSYSPDAERFTHPQAAAEHPAQSQVSDPLSQSCEDVQRQQAQPACQQAEDPEAEPSRHHDAVPEPQGASAALPNHADHHHAPQVASEQHHQPQQRQQCGSFGCTPHTGASAADMQSQQQQQMPVAQVQHDQAADQMHAPARSPSPSSHPSASQQGGVPPNSDSAQAQAQAQTQAGVQEAGPTPSPTAAAAAVLAAQSPQRLHPVPLLDPALLAQLSRHARPQSPDAAAPTHHHPPNDTERTRSVTPVASASAVVGQQPACVTAAAAAAQSTLSSDSPSKPQQQVQPEASPLSAPDGSEQGQVRISPNAVLPASPMSSLQPDAPRPGSAQQLDEEHFEQDQLSQDSSSESDEDFQPSEYEQDELSQPSSSSDDEEEDEGEDAFEVDELSQPESSSDEQSPLRAESGGRVHSASQAQPPHMLESEHQDLPGSRDESLKPQTAATAASGRSGAKLSRQGSLSADHKARLGFPKPAQPAKAVPVQKGYLTGNSLPFNPQTLPIVQLRQGLKRPVQDVAAQQGGLKRMRTMKSVNDVHKVSAREAGRLDEEYDLPAPAAQQVTYTWHNKQKVWLHQQGSSSYCRGTPGKHSLDDTYTTIELHGVMYHLIYWHANASYV